jgi:hypothetical protein
MTVHSTPSEPGPSDPASAVARPSVLATLASGAQLRPLEITVNQAANERYWRAAGVGHPALEAGALYPPIAANLTILCFQQTCPHPMIQTRQHLQCHRIEQAGAPLVVTGRVSARYAKRGREYVDVDVQVCSANRPDDPIWTSRVSFTPTAELSR